MEIIIGNEDKRNYSNMKMKARVLLENSRGEIVVSSYGGIYLLPGGSIDDGENPNTAILREIKEEDR
jgi:8-oxo-dGTP pyrophosphatase MutT (NUDIX family)